MRAAIASMKQSFGKGVPIHNKDMASVIYDKWHGSNALKGVIDTMHFAIISLGEQVHLYIVLINESLKTLEGGGKY